VPKEGEILFTKIELKGEKHKGGEITKERDQLKF
jgi:hypothetical protein